MTSSLTSVETNQPSYPFTSSHRPLTNYIRLHFNLALEFENVLVIDLIVLNIVIVMYS